MLKHTADLLYTIFHGLFTLKMPCFSESQLSGRIKYVRDFPEKNLRIVVDSPVLRHADGSISNFTNQYVGLKIEDNKGNKVEFVDSRVTNNDKWENIVTDKVNTLIKLVEGIRPCSKCNDGTYPYPFVDSAPQGRPESTRFVWCRCPKCRNKYETEYGTGLRTKISRYLKKK